ncbi:hypothetical protein ACJMK2_029612, partial [Sinanodonta woodiana]
CPNVNVNKATETTIKSDSEVGKTMQFLCNNRFVIQGYEKITCQADYTWDHEAPFCE